jgi:glyoxylase-like metal-dependent hydrolase (beta-lactamase superfamily II)
LVTSGGANSALTASPSPARRLQPTTSHFSTGDPVTPIQPDKPVVRSGFSDFDRILPEEDWFEVYQIKDNLFCIHEPRHYEGTTINLVVGKERAALIDTGCGIGDLRGVVEKITSKPILVVNTHTHLDHLGSNHQFSDVAMLDHPLSRQIAGAGVAAETYHAELLAENLVQLPWPEGFDPKTATLLPFKVTRWLRDSDHIDIGGAALEVVYTPGEAADNICLLDRASKLLFSSDILLHGGVWTHLDGGSVSELVGSYRRLMHHLDDFDRIMPSHGRPWLDKSLLPESLAAAEQVLAGSATPTDFVDPWGRRLKKYSFGRFNIQTR